MKTYEIELEDGKIYEVDLEEPKQIDKSIDTSVALKEGAKSILSPSPEQMTQGGLDIAQRFGQATLGSLYGQARGVLQESVPEGVKQTIGQTTLSSMLPGGMATANLLSPKIQQAIGNEGAGLGIDVAAGLGTSALIKGGSLLGRPLSSTGKIIESVYKSGSNLKGVESEIKALSSMPSEGEINRGANQGIRILSQAEKSMKEEVENSGKQSLSELTSTFSNRKSFLDKAITKESIKKSGDAKLKLKSLFNNMTNIYRKGLEKAEKALETRGETLTKGDLHGVIGDTITELEGRGLNVQSPVRSIIDNKIIPTLNEINGDKVTLSQAKDIKNLVFNELSESGKEGSKYFDELDSAKNLFLKNYGNLIGERSPELQALNSEFAPLVQARQWATRKFKPFNIQEIQRGADVLKRISSSSKPNQTDLNYLKILEEGSGRFKGTGSLSGEGLTKLGTESKSLQDSFNNAKRNIIDSIDASVAKIEDSFKPDISSVKKSRFEQVLGFQERQGRLQELSSKKTQLQNLKRIRNWAIGLTLGATIGRPAANFIFRAKGLHNLDVLNQPG